MTPALSKHFVSLPGRLAVYCQNCGMVSNSPGERCLVCDSSLGLLSLGQVLNLEAESGATLRGPKAA